MKVEFDYHRKQIKSKNEEFDAFVMSIDECRIQYISFLCSVNREMLSRL